MSRSLAHTALVNQILDVSARLPWLILWPNRSGRLTSASGRVIPTGLCRGAADLIGILDGGTFVAIEVKTGRARPSALQSHFLDEVIRKMGIAFIARNLTDLAANLVDHILPSRYLTLREAIGSVEARRR